MCFFLFFILYLFSQNFVLVAILDIAERLSLKTDIFIIFIIIIISRLHTGFLSKFHFTQYLWIIACVNVFPLNSSFLNLYTSIYPYIIKWFCLLLNVNYIIFLYMYTLSLNFFLSKIYIFLKFFILFFFIWFFLSKKIFEIFYIICYISKHFS